MHLHLYLCACFSTCVYVNIERPICYFLSAHRSLSVCLSVCYLVAYLICSFMYVYISLPIISYNYLHIWAIECVYVCVCMYMCACKYLCVCISVCVFLLPFLFIHILCKSKHEHEIQNSFISHKIYLTPPSPFSSRNTAHVWMQFPSI